jgi:ATP-dependent Clp protease ATP-binding subunit ClpA
VTALDERMRERDIEVRCTDEAAAVLRDQGYSPRFGAREMNRVFERLVERPLAGLLVQGAVGAGSVVTIGATGSGGIDLSVATGTHTQIETV